MMLPCDHFALFQREGLQLPHHLMQMRYPEEEKKYTVITLPWTVTTWYPIRSGVSDGSVAMGPQGTQDSGIRGYQAPLTFARGLSFSRITKNSPRFRREFR